MQPFTVVSGPAAPLMLANVDTDVIVRIERLASEPREALGQFAFEALRFRPDGSEDPAFVLNQPPFRGAPLLLADANFGCGSSREGAVWALQALGIRSVIAPSFGDIFFSNCFQNGVLPIRLPAEQVRALATLAAGGAPFTVDLPNDVVVAPDGSRWPFEVEPMRRASLLEGLDDIGLTLKHAGAIDDWERADLDARPWNWPTAASATTTR
jgi:3-isopropylmalate/(R)-2-methylmalate dehydratase small subunit